jgi:hypothetical protein
MLLGFYKQFVEPIQLGSKVFTIRKARKVSPKIGETLYMYTGGYNSSRTLISDKEKLMGIQSVRILVERCHTHWWSYFTLRIFVDRRQLTDAEIEQFVKYDGFKGQRDFAMHWLGKKKLRTGALMKIYHWTDLKY